ncbi:MAG: phosphate starvation-inducible protein PsiF [Gammaproteobacteria bacterium]|nr:phosphate starvation-inducible protein PsiF [Gammaproteobacteria bacterium]
MSRLRIPALAIAALLGLGMAITASAQSSQQMLMKHCNAEASAKHLMASSRREFMQTCLRSPSKRHLSLNAQQRRMRDCNAQAKAKRLRSNDHKRFMSSCLKQR